MDDPVSQVEARLLRWMAKQADPFRIDVVGALVVGKGVEAVVTNTRTGRQGLWPAAWAWDGDGEELPLFRQKPKVQMSLF